MLFRDHKTKSLPLPGPFPGGEGNIIRYRTYITSRDIFAVAGLSFSAEFWPLTLALSPGSTP